MGDLRLAVFEGVVQRIRPCSLENRFEVAHRVAFRSRKAWATTETELKLMAALAIMGLSRSC